MTPPQAKRRRLNFWPSEFVFKVQQAVNASPVLSNKDFNRTLLQAALDGSKPLTPTERELLVKRELLGKLMKKAMADGKAMHTLAKLFHQFQNWHRRGNYTALRRPRTGYLNLAPNIHRRIGGMVNPHNLAALAVAFPRNAAHRNQARNARNAAQAHLRRAVEYAVEAVADPSIEARHKLFGGYEVHMTDNHDHTVILRTPSGRSITLFFDPWDHTFPRIDSTVAAWERQFIEQELEPATQRVAQRNAKKFAALVVKVFRNLRSLRANNRERSLTQLIPETKEFAVFFDHFNNNSDVPGWKVAAPFVELDINPQANVPVRLEVFNHPISFERTGTRIAPIYSENVPAFVRQAITRTITSLI